MASMTKTCLSVSVSSSINQLKPRQSRAGQCVSRSAVIVRSQQTSNAGITRREVNLAGFSAALAFVAAAPAQAFLGIGEPPKDDVYKAETASIISSVRDVINLAKDAPNRAETVLAVRKQTNTWVAKYRRDDSFGGRPSYGATYTALNALAGHFNSFGPTAPLPKKRFERITKELEDAEKMLARGR